MSVWCIGECVYMCIVDRCIWAEWTDCVCMVDRCVCICLYSGQVCIYV